MRDFLVEILTEELPPTTLWPLANHFLEKMQLGLRNASLSFASAHVFATPRRLAVLVKKLQEKQVDSIIERKGPSLAAAFDAQGNTTSACMGFARSCGVSPEDLITLQNAEGEWVGFRQTVRGESVETLLPRLTEDALKALPISKPMRWSDLSVEFVRPVHSVLMLYGNDIVPATLFGLASDRETRGHRFLSKRPIQIANPARYVKSLEKKYVIADFEQRKKTICEKAHAIAKETLGSHASVVIQEALLNEVTGLVEWPVAICGSFDAAFLSVPKEVLISAMQDHQRYFPVVDAYQKLLPHFIAISNIPSENPQHVIQGNERVLRARLSDAKFFFESDLKQLSMDRLERLKEIIFQQKLGTLYDKSERLAKLTAHIAAKLGLSTDHAKQVGLLAKTDLTTQLVGEFPELQGMAGYYYASKEGFSSDIANAMYEQYLPAFAGDQLPASPMGCAIAIADRLDTLIGLFGIHQPPTGEKDPFALRRSALGVLRILIEKQLDLDLNDLLQKTVECYQNHFDSTEIVPSVLRFMVERLKPWYQEQGISADVLAAVNALHITRLSDLHLRIQAVQAFKQLPEALSLSIANKRVSNILSKYSEALSAKVIDETLFEHAIEKELAEQIKMQHDRILHLSDGKHYAAILTHLATLKKPIDEYFDTVLVMTEETNRRENRLLLLKQLRELFLHVADIALLQ